MRIVENRSYSEEPLHKGKNTIKPLGMIQIFDDCAHRVLAHGGQKMEQKIVDLCFEIALTMADNSSFFKEKNHEEIAGWVADQLKKNGFPTKPIGMSWGVLQ